MADSYRIRLNTTTAAQAVKTYQLGIERVLLRRREWAARAIATRSRRFVPRTKYPNRRGGLAASLRSRGTTVITTVAQGPVHQWGGTIAPRGTPIRIRRSEMVTRAREEFEPTMNAQIERDIAQVVR